MFFNFSDEIINNKPAETLSDALKSKAFWQFFLIIFFALSTGIMIMSNVS